MSYSSHSCHRCHHFWVVARERHRQSRQYRLKRYKYHCLTLTYIRNGLRLLYKHIPTFREVRSRFNINKSKCLKITHDVLVLQPIHVSSYISTFPVPSPWSPASALLCEDRCQIWYKSPTARYVKVQPLVGRVTERRPLQRQVRRDPDVWMSTHPDLVPELNGFFLKVTDFLNTFSWKRIQQSYVYFCIHTL